MSVLVLLCACLVHWQNTLFSSFLKSSLLRPIVLLICFLQEILAAVQEFQRSKKKEGTPSSTQPTSASPSRLATPTQASRDARSVSQIDESSLTPMQRLKLKKQRDADMRAEEVKGVCVLLASSIRPPSTP